jgi:protein gp37
MSATSSIEWTQATWNPVTGCTEVSEGCDHCYAKTFAERWRGTPGHPYEQGFDLKLWPERLSLPKRWRKPRRVFVNSMSDLFHDDVPDDFIVRAFDTMANTRRHTYQVLTKRPGRMASFMRRYTAGEFGPHAPESVPVGVLPNVWLGTSVETQKWADVRIPKLLETPAAVRFLSCEPLLGPLDLSDWLPTAAHPRERLKAGRPYVVRSRLHWVIVGGESGPHARPMQVEWARQLHNQAEAAGVAFFFKHWGGRTPKAGGRLLDGRTWDEYPEVGS